MAVDRRSVLGGLAASIISLRPSRSAEGAQDATILEAREGSLMLRPGTESRVWGYGGNVPGPVLRLPKGRNLKVQLVNKLQQPTTLCWHGVRCPNAMDGVGGLTQPPVAPGETFDYHFTPPDSGLFWFHPHVFPHSAEQVDRGLYGVLIVDEPDPPKADGEMLIVVDDWLLDAKGQVAPFEPDQVHPLLTINAKPLPLATQTRPGARLRLRLLNVCSTRIVQIGFEGVEANVIAIDGQPSEVFEPARRMIPIGPGSRFEVMVDVPREAGKTARLSLWHGDRAAEDLLTIKAAGNPREPYPPVAKLPDNPALPTRIHLERSLRRTLEIDRLMEARIDSKAGGPTWLWSLGGVSSNGFSGKPLFTVPRDGVVTLTFVNRTATPQQMHVHGHAFRLLHDLDDGWDPYWRDSVLLTPGKTKHIAFVADNPGKWAIESLMLDRQVTGLAGWFEVT